MNTAQANPALSQLEDIMLPEQISQLPIAPGFWILAIVFVAIIIFAVTKLQQNRRYIAPKKAALSELEILDVSTPQYATDINTLLKRTAMSYFPREDFAKLDGDIWYAWLALRLSAQDANQMSELLKKRYQKDGLAQKDCMQLRTLTEKWLNKSGHFIALNKVPVQAQSTPKNQQSEATCSQ
ncbi:MULTISPECIES: DUF4381 domain-containing protein [Shewanella]|uniref:DUF4381 domain-containing protein n=1 Tax=Shewanella TaxID=22 RepID=UPI001BC25144|nr:MULTISPECIES: DUF4381 domain-containing protein [Shewanella]GIU53372.1 hypothetical protein TUM4249_30130 [Shewanella sp. KT0246]